MPLVVWLVTDQKPGHVSQLLGLLSALEAFGDEVGGVEPHWIETPYAPADDCRPPDLIVCAGRTTQKPALTLQRRHGGRSVVLMKPQTLFGRFDLAVIPEHDQPATRPDVLATRGALNAMQPSLGDPDRGVILLGGPSKHVAWNDAHVLHQLDMLKEMFEPIRWTLTTSRRTPESMLCPLIERQSPSFRVIPCEQTPPGWVAEKLGDVGHAVVTEDSVSMISEAATAGCVTSVLHVPSATRTPSRVLQGVQTMIDHGVVCRLEDRPDFVPDATLDEASRVARHIITRWFGDEFGRKAA